MIIDDYGDYDGLGLAQLVRDREVSAHDLVDTAIDAIERLNPDVNCVVQTLRDRAIAAGLGALPAALALAALLLGI